MFPVDSLIKVFNLTSPSLATNSRANVESCGVYQLLEFQGQIKPEFGFAVERLPFSELHLRHQDAPPGFWHPFPLCWRKSEPRGQM